MNNMEEVTGIGIGISDFRNLRERKNYFIDKTMFIKDIIDDQSGVTLITRPRRFGKTLNMSMLRYYFDCTKKNTAELFEGLKIMQQEEKYTSKQGAYPCIYLTLKDVTDKSFSNMILDFKTAILEMYREHRYLLDSDKIYEDEKARIMDILYTREDENVLKSSVRELSGYLYRHFEKPVIILIDEYDVPLQSAYVQGYYDEAIEFLKNFYKLSFKDNPYMEKTVLTGVSRVAKESIFSGANNFKVFTILNNEFADDFGITSDEIDEVLKDFKVQEEKEEIKKWYDGYRIGNVEGIYNPWSILNFLTDGVLQPYWVNTSSNDLIKLIVKKSVGIKEKIYELIEGKAIEVPINLETIIVGIEDRTDNIWGLMLGTGYLKIVEQVDKRRYKVKLPNYEIKSLFEDIVEDWFSNKVSGEDLRSILNDLVNLRIPDFQKKFRRLVEEMFSYMDVGRDTAENFYHAFVLGLLVGLKDTYYIKSNRESGLGRYDIMLEPKDKNGNGFIIEFKIAEDMEEDTLEELLEKAKEQIEVKKYDVELRERGIESITKMVMACKGKQFKMEIL